MFHSSTSYLFHSSTSYLFHNSTSYLLHISTSYLFYILGKNKRQTFLLFSHFHISCFILLLQICFIFFIFVFIVWGEIIGLSPFHISCFIFDSYLYLLSEGKHLLVKMLNYKINFSPTFTFPSQNSSLLTQFLPLSEQPLKICKMFPFVKRQFLPVFEHPLKIRKMFPFVKRQHRNQFLISR